MALLNSSPLFEQRFYTINELIKFEGKGNCFVSALSTFKKLKDTYPNVKFCCGYFINMSNVKSVHFWNEVDNLIFDYSDSRGVYHIADNLYQRINPVFDKSFLSSFYFSSFIRSSIIHLNLDETQLLYDLVGIHQDFHRNPSLLSIYLMCATILQFYNYDSQTAMRFLLNLYFPDKTFDLYDSGQSL